VALICGAHSAAAACLASPADPHQHVMQSSLKSGVSTPRTPRSTAQVSRDTSRALRSPRSGVRSSDSLRRSIRFQVETHDSHLVCTPKLMDTNNQKISKAKNPFSRENDPEYHIQQLHARRDANDVHVQRIADVLASKRDTFFGMLRTRDLQGIAKQCKLLKVSEGGLLFRQGDESDCMYVVIQGGFRVAKDFIHSPPELATAEELALVEAGDVVGDTGFFRQVKRSAFVQALTNSEVLKITHPIMTALKIANPGLARHVDTELWRKDNLSQKREKNAHQVEIAHDKTESLEVQEIVHALNSNLEKMIHFRKSIKTNLRKRWRTTLDHTLHEAKEIRHRLETQESGARSSSVVVFDKDMGHHFESEGLKEMFGLISNETTEDDRAWLRLQDLLNLYPECVDINHPSQDVTLLHLACIEGVPKLVSTLIGHGADPNKQNSKGQTALHLLLVADKARRPDGSLDQDRLQSLRLLCAHGAMLLRDKDGKSALDLAQHDIPRVVLKELLNEQLLSCADPACRNRSPLILCSRCKLAKYCCSDHANHHWQHHRLVCNPTAGSEVLKVLCICIV
jgi:CRP-like cAMP-binding protein